MAGGAAGGRRFLPLSYVAAGALVLLLLATLVGCLTFVFMARSKRATRGTYSPSRQEMTGARLPPNDALKRPPEERLI